MIRNKDSKFIASDLALNSVHAVITDPPYSLGFLNLNWDQALPPIEIWKACYQVLRPGGFLLAFGHVKLYHRLGCQLEDAGFEIKDCLCWGYACGNPRPLNIDRAIDKEAGITINTDSEVYKPSTDAAKVWQGWANNLKTSWEPIILVQKPLEGKYVDNVQKYNVGGLNIDECRIPFRDEKDKKTLESFRHFEGKNYGDDRYFSANIGSKKQCNIHPGGRWPANLIWLDPLFVEYDHIFMIPKPSRREKGDYNEHSTVKPVELMERLIRLVTPRPSVVGEKVIVLDPFMGCYDSETQVLSVNGWKCFEELTLQDEVISRTLAGEIVHECPTAVQAYDYEGDMVRVLSRSTDLFVTPNHNMLVQTHADFCAGRHARFIEASELNMNLYRIPCGGKFVPKYTDLSSCEMYLLGMYVSEGYLDKYGLIICQNQGEKWDIIVEKLSSLKPRQRDHRRLHIRISNEFRDFILAHCGKSKYHKFLSSRLLNTQHLDSLYQGMMIGDGHTTKDGHQFYYTVSPELAAGFQQLALKLGYNTTVSVRSPRLSIIEGREIRGTTDQFNISVRRSKSQKIITREHNSLVPYNGKVYCCTVPSHVLFVMRNGKTSWCGNSGTTGIAAKNLQRHFEGYEIDPESFKTASRRLKEKTSNYPDMFAV